MGLDDGLVDELTVWGQEGDCVKGPPGGWDAWRERGAGLTVGCGREAEDVIRTEQEVAPSV